MGSICIAIGGLVVLQGPCLDALNNCGWVLAADVDVVYVCQSRLNVLLECEHKLPECAPPPSNDIYDPVPYDAGLQAIIQKEFSKTYGKSPFQENMTIDQIATAARKLDGTNNDIPAYHRLWSDTRRIPENGFLWFVAIGGVEVKECHCLLHIEDGKVCSVWCIVGNAEAGPIGYPFLLSGTDQSKEKIYNKFSERFQRRFDPNVNAGRFALPKSKCPSAN